MALDAITNPIKAVIYKKTLDNGQVAYVPYFPRTDAEWVSLNETITIHGTEKAANTDLETIIKALNSSIGAPTASASSATNASLQAQINYISEELISKSGAFVYKGSLDPSQATGGIINPSSNAKPGWVYNVSTPFNLTSSGGIQYVAEQKDAQYGAGTNVVIIDDGSASNPIKFDPLAGDMGNHALTSEAIGLASLSGSTITFTHVDGSTAGTITFSTIGTTSVGTVGIAATSESIVSGSSQLVTAGAVYSFASSAGQVKVTAASEGYLIGVGTYASTDSNLAKAPLDFNIHVTGGTATTPTLAANISGNAETASSANYAISAGSAGYAGYVSNNFTVFGQVYNGSVAKTVSRGNGLTISSGSNTTTISVGGGDGITINTYGISVNKGKGLIFGNNGVLDVNANTSNTIKVAGDGIGLETSGVAAGTYSAVQVDTYGRATAGGQSIVFANSTSDPDLNQLVVGGLAFVSS